jgi:hypothetical protein
VQVSTDTGPVATPRAVVVVVSGALVGDEEHPQSATAANTAIPVNAARRPVLPEAT